MFFLRRYRCILLNDVVLQQDDGRGKRPSAMRMATDISIAATVCCNGTNLAGGKRNGSPGVYRGMRWAVIDRARRWRAGAVRAADEDHLSLCGRRRRGCIVSPGGPASRPG